MLRPDISKAIDGLPINIKEQITTLGGESRLSHFSGVRGHEWLSARMG